MTETLRLAASKAAAHAIGPRNFDPNRRPRGAPAPSARAIKPIDAETVIARLEEAGQTLLALPNTGHTTALRQTRPQFVAEAVAAYGAENLARARPPVPPPARITRMDHAFAWITLIPADRLTLRRIVGCRSLVSPLTGRHLFTWRRLARLLGADHKAIGRWHATGIDLIVEALNRDAAALRLWDRLG